MARRLTFEQFKQRVAAPSPKVRVLAKYVEFDPTSPVPNVTNIGSWGHTLEEMIEAKEYLPYLVVRPSASDVMTEV